MTPIRPDILQRQQQMLERNRRRQMAQALQQPQPVAAMPAPRMKHFR